MLTTMSVLKISILVVLLQAISPEVLKCNLPGNFTLDIHSNLTADVYFADLHVSLDYQKLEFYGYPEKKFITIRAKHVTVDFNGIYRDNFVPTEINSEPRKFNETFDDEITGNAQRIWVNDTTYMIYNCRLILLPIKEEKSSTPMITRNEIRRFAESCLEYHVCEKFKMINHWEFIESPSNGKFCFSPGMPSSLGDFIAGVPYESKADLGAFQDIINKVVDVTLSGVITHLDQVNGSMSLPNITHEFKTGVSILKVAGLFEASGGTFSDLTSLHRSGNVEITRIRNTFRASCGVGLSTAHLHFPKYQLKYGIGKVSGKIDGNIDGIKLEAAASIDYSQKPCIQKIEKIQVTEFGDVTVFLTGLWPLNSLLGSIVDIIVNAWKNNIVQTVEDKMMIIAEHSMKNFDCEKYRP